MNDSSDRSPSQRRHTDTRVVTAGRHPPSYHGFVNPPVYHASTVLYPNAEDYVAHRARYQYGRVGTPTTEALESALAELEGPQCAGVALLPSGLAAISTALLAVLKAGDHLLVTDNAYGPTRAFCEQILPRFGIATTFYDPAIGTGISRAVSPGHARRLSGVAWLAQFRDPGHRGHREDRARQRRPRSDGQYLGDAALFPPA